MVCDICLGSTFVDKH